jgi:hypothetical protein
VVAPALLVALPHAARAICGQPPPAVVSPHRGDTAPLNANVVMTMPSDWRAKSALTIKTAPAPGKPRVAVAAKERAWVTVTVERVELVPEAALSPSTAYEVWNARGEILGAFRTGTTADTTAPTWGGLKSGHTYRITPISNVGGHKVITIDMECGEGLLDLFMDAYAEDDQTPASSVRYALWAAAPPRAIDYTTPPLGWLTISPEQQKLAMRPGTPPSYMLDYGTTESYSNDVVLPAIRPLKVGVRAIDLAGNATAPSELTVK